MNFTGYKAWSVAIGVFISMPAFALDCKQQKTQTDMNMCAAAELERETGAINKTYGALRTKLNPQQQLQLKEVQLAWIKFKDLACKFEASGVDGGSAHSIVLSNCLTNKTRVRNKELVQLNNCQEGDLSCPQ